MGRSWTVKESAKRTAWSVSSCLRKSAVEAVAEEEEEGLEDFLLDVEGEEEVADDSMADGRRDLDMVERSGEAQRDAGGTESRRAEPKSAVV